ncbi:putative Sodium/dicarboxylate symporter [Polychaeton citri CBS 116435]|uniref:Amino acid transporter n=1 Tax=Polychaeton citri CBS 116435 TaxID=1314669 RepID=A0A9P4Q917_9PEZI|nr:putative Sodium/dicarboxylate symporter [Polychaeton citri CBS 116435]
MAKPQDGETYQQQVSLEPVQSPIIGDSEPPKRRWYQSLCSELKTPGSALQILIAAAIAIAIGVSASATVDEIPEAAPALLQIPGDLWLRGLRATVLPLIVCAMILAVQNLKAMAKDGAKLARWTIFYYLATTCLAVVHSMVLVDLVWRRLMVEVSEDALQVAEADQETVDERAGNAPHDIVVNVAYSFIPANVVAALADDSLLAVLVTAVIVGCLIQGPDSSLLRAIREIEKIVMTIITFLIKLAPIGVFFLILGNLMTLDIADIGLNLGILIGGSITGMFIHLFLVLPLLFFIFTRSNPYAYWLKCSPAWITAWGTASSAGTMPITLRCCRARGISETVLNFTIPLGTLVNMDGTAIYFPMVVVFLAATQGRSLNAGDYTIIVLLSTLSSIATTPIPSSSLVLTVMIANSVGIPITGMYAVVVAIDWFIDRFRTATNVSGDLYAAKILQQVTKIVDKDAADVTPGLDVSQEDRLARDKAADDNV